MFGIAKFVLRTFKVQFANCNFCVAMSFSYACYVYNNNNLCYRST